MVLKGQAKTDYQREYMRDWQRKRRGSKQQGLNIARVIPNSPDIEDTNPSDIEYIDADGNPVYA